MAILKNVIGNKIIYKPQGFLDSNYVGEMITPLDINMMEKKNTKCVAVDFSKIISANMNAIRFLNDIFESLYKKDINCSIFNANNNIYTILNNLENCYFNYFENEEIMKIFCYEDFIPQNDVYLLVDDEQNKNMLIFNLVKKGITPYVVNSEEDIGNSDAIVIKKSFISKISDRVMAVMKNDIIYFYFNGFLDANVLKKFDIEYFRRNLLIGFKAFVFDMNNVKGMNVHAVRFLSKLGVEAAEYGAMISIIGLSKKNIQPSLIKDLEAVGFIFFKDEDEFLNSKELKEVLKSSSAIYKKSRKITKDFIKILPFFVNATIYTIEMLTGVKSKKEKPNLKEVNVDTSREDLIASSIGFYGDLDGVLILIFSENLSKNISKILIGEEFKTKEELVDMIGEFANIIVGNVKLELEKHDIDINLTLPKVFENLKELKNIVINKQGIEVKFYFNDEEFYFYLTR
ncbi:chemotaxis protein CheX [Caminibacter mediatlanticus]|uniref:CheC, inhibitor of MCP methylation n=1 Tax=Caminibacter mediatlanticus TB-2 TaxID=391592 RepID=A0AAI9F312_9BACT|nr:chemotaxis protein CheX [Caminibacter mediatlanticus]EDM24156.1 CheC, inhibitor of MCP methylation [Caminibacter mediatlanticus TB-2]